MLWALIVLVAALSHTTPVLAQGLPPGGYYADGAYYVPNDPPASAAPAAPNQASACPVGYGVPTVYIASTPTMVRIYHLSPVGGDAPGFPYVPVYPSPAEC